MANARKDWKGTPGHGVDVWGFEYWTIKDNFKISQNLRFQIY